MNHVRVKDFLSKENKHSETTFRRCVNRHEKDVLPKTKRLKSRKERSLMRDAGKDASRTKSHHRHCHYQTCKDSTHFLKSCHHSCGLRREATFAKVVPTVQEPSIITDNRLIGHHSLFNHEVKSVDIQRSLNEQGHLETGERTAQDENHPSLALNVLSPVSSNDFLETDTDDVVPFETKISPVTNVREKEVKTNHESNLTPGQRPPQRSKSVVTAKNTSPHVGMSKNEKANPVGHKTDQKPQLNPSVDGDTVKTSCKKAKKHMTPALNHTPKNPESHLSPNPFQFSSSPSIDTLGTLHRGPDSCCISMVIATIASRLSDWVQFPHLRRRDLLAESRELLMKALMDTHGPNKLPHLRLREQRHDLSFNADLTHRVQKYDRALTIEDENDLMATDVSASQVDPVGPSCFDTQNTTTIKHFSSKTCVQPQQSLNLTAALWTSPEDSSARLSNDILEWRSSPQRHMDFQPRGAAAGDYLFMSSPASCWRDKQSSSQTRCTRYKRPPCKESTIFVSLENHTKAYKENSGGPQRRSARPVFPCQSQLTGRPSAEPLHFPLKQDPFKTKGHPFASSSPTKIHPPCVSSHSQPFSQFSHPLIYPLLSSHHADMMHYPPSHMLERSPASHLSSLPSLEHWSFPPMKLY